MWQSAIEGVGYGPPSRTKTIMTKGVHGVVMITVLSLCSYGYKFQISGRNWGRVILKVKFWVGSYSKSNFGLGSAAIFRNYTKHGRVPNDMGWGNVLKIQLFGLRVVTMVLYGRSVDVRRKTGWGRIFK